MIGNTYCGNKDFAAKEVGYIVNKRYQKKGYATEALSAVIAQVFREGAHRVNTDQELAFAKKKLPIRHRGIQVRELHLAN